MRKLGIAIAIITFVIACKEEQKRDTNQKEIAMETTIMQESEIAKKEIKQVLETLFNGVDYRNWEAVKSTMTDSIYTDYQALGGKAGFVTPTELVNGWQQLLPGFDSKVHQIHNEAIWVAGNRATATLDAIATHYLNNDEWTVFIGYDTEFIRENEQWKLARIDLSLYNQTGNSALPAQAIEIVKNGKVKDFAEVNPEKKATIEAFFQALEQKNLQNVLQTMTDDVVQAMPLAPENFPKALKGITAIEKQYSGVMNYEQTYKRTYYATQNPNDILVKYSGTVTTNEGKPYNNSYVGIFSVNDHNKIEHFTEYFNPTILLNSWPGLQPITYSMHAAGARTDSGVTMENVVFLSNGVQLKGHLFLPPNFDENKTYRTAIVTGSWTSIKEQMPDEYASVLSKDVFITLTFDFTGFGESEGQPRQVEDYKLKINDIKAAVDFLSEHKNVNATQLTGLGVCASSGYMAHAVAQDDRIKKLVLVAPWLHDAEIAKMIYDMRPGGTEGLLNKAKAAKEKYAETGVMDYVLAASELDPYSAMYVPENAFDYYLNPAKAAGVKYDNRFAVSSWEPWLTFDGISAGKQIQQPVFIVHSESGAVPQGAKAFFDHLKGEKDIKWLNQFNQQQLYYEKEAVHTAMKEVVDYLKS
jgi:ketosteroid isomerase-like protein/pimeloyl-ACP methyl ester carboxylesterase